MIIYLARHGEIDKGEEKSFVGQVDLPLTGKGLKQAEKLRARLADTNLAGIHCSDLSRSLVMAKIIAVGHTVPPVADTGLREIYLGAWEGQSFAYIRRNYPFEFARRGEDIAGYRPPGGESFAIFRDRIMDAFNRIVESSGGDLLLVGHAGVNRIIISHLLGMPLQNIFRIYQEYACLNIIYRNKHGYRIKLLNSTEHLKSGITPKSCKLR